MLNIIKINVYTNDKIKKYKHDALSEDDINYNLCK